MFFVFYGCMGFTTDWTNADASEFPASVIPAIPSMDLDSVFNASENHVSYPVKFTYNLENFGTGTITFDGGDDEYVWIEGWFGAQTRQMRFRFVGDTLQLTFMRNVATDDGEKVVEEKSFAFVGGVPGELVGIWMLADAPLYVKFEKKTMTIAF